MPNVTRASGVRLDVPESVRVDDAAIRPRPAAPRRGTRAFEARSLPLAPAAAAAEHAEVLAALQQQELQLVDAVQLETTAPPAAGPGGSWRGRAEPEPPLVTLSLDLAPDQGAVALVEQDGCYSWKLPLPEPAAPAAAAVRGPAAEPPAPGRVPIRRRHAPAAGRRGRGRGAWSAADACAGPGTGLRLPLRHAAGARDGDEVPGAQRPPGLVNMADDDPNRGRRSPTRPICRCR